MTDDELAPLAEEAIRVEQHISNLYLIFFEAFPEDAEFWWQLVIEEKNHAALIRSGLEYFLPAGRFPAEMLPSMLDGLRKTNRRLTDMIEGFHKKPPSRQEAFNTALQVEQSAGEIHFQRAMTKEADSDIMEIFQQLNKDDMDHANRIQSYMEQKGIQIEKTSSGETTDEE